MSAASGMGPDPATFVDSLFGGTIESAIKCHVCGTVRVRFVRLCNVLTRCAAAVRQHRAVPGPVAAAAGSHRTGSSAC
jgi:hypothetical protein